MNLLVNGIFLVTLLTLLPHNEAALARGIYRDPKHPGKCVIKPNLILSVGESAPYPDMECARVTCQSGSEGVIATCGVVLPPGGYKLGAPKKPNAPYPDCCDRHFVKVN